MAGCHPSVKSELHCEHGVSHYSETACGICTPLKIEWTICGFCLERVKVNAEHGCELIKSIKEKFNSALAAIQHNAETTQNHLSNRVDSLKKSVDELLKQVRGIDYLIKQMGLCVDNSHVESTAKMLKKHGVELPTIADLNKTVKQEIKNVLFGSNSEGLAYVDENKIGAVVDTTENSYEIEIKRLTNIVHSLSDERWELQKRLDTLIECLDLKQGEINQLTHRMEELVKKFNADNGGYC